MERECLFYNKLDDKFVQCLLCHHQCKIAVNKIGVCGVRKNIDGQLFALTYGKFCSTSIDPIEKKPLYHFYPQKDILSLGSIGCNLKCFFCQNYEISQQSIDDFAFRQLSYISPEKIIQLCFDYKTNLVAFTYNEPLIMYEYLIDAVPLLKEKNIKSVLVTNGTVNETAAEELSKIVDAANIDLKSFSVDFYKNNCKGSLEYVKKFIKIFSKNNVHIELTNLIVTSLNDNISEIEDMINWIADLDTNIPLHFSKYGPRYKADMPPTNEKIMIQAYNAAKEKLNYVYLGNVGLADYGSTFCPDCGRVLISRTFYSGTNNLVNNNQCPDCDFKIAGVF